MIAGMVGVLVSMENSLLGLGGFAVALLVAIPLGVVAGYLYSLLLNRVAGQEMMVGTYVGFRLSLECAFSG